MTGKKNLRVRFAEAIEIRELELSDEERESKSAHWRQIQERKREMKVSPQSKLLNDLCEGWGDFSFYYPWFE